MPVITIDPVTRIEGHLHVEVEVEGGRVTNAWTTSTLFRGMETIVENRPWWDAQHYTERVCGVCPVPHGHNSAFALEDAAGVDIPPNGRLIRNLLECTQLLHDHVLWFYILNGLDYVDIVSALGAQTQDQSLRRVQARLQAFVDSGQLGFLDNAYFGHPAYNLPPELNLQLAAHYLEAVTVQAVASEATAIFGGKFPHHMSTPPGGYSSFPHEEQINSFEFKVRQVKDFIDNKMIPDLLAIAPYYLEQAQIGAGHGNYLSWGVLDEDLETGDPYARYFPRGAVFGALEGNLNLEQAESEDVSVWYTSTWQNPRPGEEFDVESQGLHPFDAKQIPDFTGPHGISEVSAVAEEGGRYAWDRSNLLKDRPVEVGPLAEMLVAYLNGNEDVQRAVDSTLQAVGQAGNIPVLFSNLGRIAARTLKVQLVADRTLVYVQQLRENMKNGDLEFFTPVPDRPSGRGFSGWDAPRGSLSHWVELEDGMVKHYSIITPSGWNFSPRSTPDRVRGPVEEALIGTPVEDPERPLEVLRTLHSFDP
ncbi:MAG: nickel-dependent hydrogenase large subunit [Thermoleophilia bacterium]